MMSVANRDKINCRNKNSFNNRIKLNNFQNNNYSDYYYNNNEKSSDSNFKSKYNYYKNEGNKEAINFKNNLNIDEKNTKKILKLKRILSKQKTLDKEIIPNKNINIDKSINDNNNRTTHNLRVLNKNRKINSTINENVLFNTHKKYNILLDIKNLINDDSKYVKFKKEIFEKASKKLHDKLSMVKDINIKIKKMKNLSKKFFIKKPIIAKDILNLNNNEINKENTNSGYIKTKNNSFNNINKKDKEKEKTIDNGELNIKNKMNMHILKIDNSKKNKTISYKFNEMATDFEYDYTYFDITKLKLNPQIPKDYLNIIYHNLLSEEDRGTIPNPDYQKIISQKEINEHMRSILIDWLIDVHYKFGFTDETLYMTVLIIDRYISYKPIQKAKFQLLGITALLLSCKHEEIVLPKIEDFIYITDNAYKKTDVFDMENDILDVLNFSLLFPSPIKFYEYLALKFNFDKKKFLTGKYLMESFMVDLKYVKYRASVIAAACVYIVMKYYKMENYKDVYNKKYYNLNENDINNKNFRTEVNVKDCAKDICIFVDNINKSNFFSCKNKYASDENEKVSLILSGEID
jgi:cyclin B